MQSGRGPLERRLKPPPVEAETVAGKELPEVLPRVLPLPGDGAHAVGQDPVPVAVVGAEASRVPAHRPERLTQVRGRRVVGLEAREYLPPTEEVGGVVREAAVLVEEVVASAAG